MKETDFARYLTQFLGVYLPGHLGSKKNTQLSYRDSFSLLLEYCRDEEKLSPEKLIVSQVDRDLVMRFLNWLEEVRGCKCTTRNQRLAAIHSFFRFLIVEAPQYMEQSQKVLNIPMKKADKPPLMYLSLDSVKGLLGQPDRNTVQGRRDAVLLSLLYDTGARVQELVDLKVCDINLNDTVTIILTGKGGKSRIVPVMAPTGDLLRKYIEGYGLSHPSKSRNPLFTNRGGKQPLTRAGVTYILKKYASQAQIAGVKDISGEITPHWLRHSKAMHLLQSGVNLVYIRDLLGHSDVSTTEIYARADESMKRKALLEAYKSPAEDKLPKWKTDKNLLDWLKSL
jgi:site-specific recombinase XerD